MDQFWDLWTLMISIKWRPPAQGTCRPTSLPHRLAFFPGQSRPPSLNKGHFSAFFGRIFPTPRLWRKYTFSQAVFNRTFFIDEKILSYSPAVPWYLSNDQFTSNNKLEIKFIFAHSAKLSLVWFDKKFGEGGGFWCKKKLLKSAESFTVVTWNRELLRSSCGCFKTRAQSCEDFPEVCKWVNLAAN